MRAVLASQADFVDTGADRPPHWFRGEGGKAVARIVGVHRIGKQVEGEFALGWSGPL